ncbi:class F sortase [Streptomyces sp. NPDC092952]|uniref:class F sortase n=1 Tax=Streptomyces sp. NPDC092952 TaxID=3366018 RepID=UPI003818C918
MPRTRPRVPYPLRSIAPPLLAALLLAGCSSAPDAPSAAPPRDVAGAAAPSTGQRAGAADSGTRAGSRSTAAAPVRVGIPSLGIDSELMRLGLNQDGTVEVPPAEKGMTAGWYTGGATPGEPGAAVIIGHNDTRYGRAVFHDLRRIAKGADITVRDEHGAKLHFTVTATESVAKKAFPTRKVYGATRTSTLRLITCDGAFDAQGHPVDNLIVYADRS